jgi:hypothetical protein
MCADDGGVDDDAFFIYFYVQCLEDRRPVPAVRPVRKAVVDRLPRAKALGQITPRNARFCSIEHRIDERPVIELGRRAPSLGNGNAHHRPLRIGQSMAVRHAQL